MPRARIPNAKTAAERAREYRERLAQKGAPQSHRDPSEPTAKADPRDAFVAHLMAEVAWLRGVVQAVLGGSESVTNAVTSVTENVTNVTRHVTNGTASRDRLVEGGLGGGLPLDLLSNNQDNRRLTFQVSRDVCVPADARESVTNVTRHVTENVTERDVTKAVTESIERIATSAPRQAQSFDSVEREETEPDPWQLDPALQRANGRGVKPMSPEDEERALAELADRARR